MKVNIMIRKSTVINLTFLIIISHVLFGQNAYSSEGDNSDNIPQFLNMFKNNSDKKNKITLIENLLKESSNNNISLSKKDQELYSSILNDYKQYLDKQNLFSKVKLEEEYNYVFRLMKIMPNPDYFNSLLYKESYNNMIIIYEKLQGKISTNIPKNIHFNWIGGPLGQIQKDYISIFAKLYPDYKIKIWYDSDALYAYKFKIKLKAFSDKEFNSSNLDDKKINPYFDIFNDGENTESQVIEKSSEYVKADEFINLQNAFL